MNTWGATSSVRRHVASTSESKRQQKHPPVISSTGNPRVATIVVSTSPTLWSFVMRPTRRPLSVEMLGELQDGGGLPGSQESTNHDVARAER